MILIHGFPGNHHGLVELARSLDNYRLILPDLPASGESEALAGKHTLSNIGDWLNEFLEKLSIEKTIILGHSFGARAALVFAGQHPGKVEKLILITPAVRVAGPIAKA